MKHSKIKLGSFNIFIGNSAFSSCSRDSQKKKPINIATEMRNGARKCASVHPSVVPPIANVESEVRTHKGRHDTYSSTRE